MNVEPCGLMEVFQRSRVVFILAATTTENQHGLDRRFFEAMPRGSVVVLVSRAGVVNWDDLLDAAASGHIRAAIDVFPDEPIAHDARVRDTSNTILSAHRAATCRKCGRKWAKWWLTISNGFCAACRRSACNVRLRASCRGCAQSLSADL
jgi:phosphoglycerate dehydrogenase-like enzyme